MPRVTRNSKKAKTDAIEGKTAQNTTPQNVTQEDAPSPLKRKPSPLPETEKKCAPTKKKYRGGSAQLREEHWLIILNLLKEKEPLLRKLICGEKKNTISMTDPSAGLKGKEKYKNLAFSFVAALEEKGMKADHKKWSKVFSSEFPVQAGQSMYDRWTGRKRKWRLQQADTTKSGGSGDSPKKIIGETEFQLWLDLHEGVPDIYPPALIQTPIPPPPTTAAEDDEEYDSSEYVSTADKQIGEREDSEVKKIKKMLKDRKPRTIEPTHLSVLSEEDSEDDGLSLSSRDSSFSSAEQREVTKGKLDKVVGDHKKKSKLATKSKTASKKTKKSGKNLNGGSSDPPNCNNASGKSSKSEMSMLFDSVSQVGTNRVEFEKEKHQENVRLEYAKLKMQQEKMKLDEKKMGQQEKTMSDILKLMNEREARQEKLMNEREARQDRFQRDMMSMMQAIFTSKGANS